MYFQLLGIIDKYYYKIKILKNYEDVNIGCGNCNRSNIEDKLRDLLSKTTYIRFLLPFNHSQQSIFLFIYANTDMCIVAIIPDTIFYIANERWKSLR